MEHDTILEHLMDIKERLASLEATQLSLREELFNHAEQSQDNHTEIVEIKKDLHVARGAISTMRWVVGLPTVLLTLIKIAEAFGG